MDRIIPFLQGWGYLVGIMTFILDKKDGYWQVKLDEEILRLCTCNTPLGKILFPFQLKFSSEVFQQQQKMRKMEYIG